MNTHAVVKNWCFKFALKGQTNYSFFSNGRNEKMLILYPNQAKRNLMMQSELKFRVFRQRFTYSIEKKLYSNNQSQQGNSTNFGQMEKTNMGEITPLCQGFTCSRVFPQAKQFGAIQAGTIIGPICEVQFCENS